MRRVRRKRRRRFVKQEDIKTIFSHYFNQYKVRLLQVIIILIPFPTVNNEKSKKKKKKKIRKTRRYKNDIFSLLQPV